MSIRSKIQALITAANNTTGESDATLTDAVQTLVDGYGQGGGGSLPSSISKIDGGEFTLASKTASTYHIEHSLGVVPKGFAIWTDGVDISTAENSNIIRGVFIVDESANGSVTSYLYQMTVYSHNFNNYPRNVGANYSGYANANYISYNIGNVSYEANVTYKWFAWA